MCKNRASSRSCHLRPARQWLSPAILCQNPHKGSYACCRTTRLHPRGRPSTWSTLLGDTSPLSSIHLALFVHAMIYLLQDHHDELIKQKENINFGSIMQFKSQICQQGLRVPNSNFLIEVRVGYLNVRSLNSHFGPSQSGLRNRAL